MQPRPAESIAHQVAAADYRPRFLLIIGLALAAAAFVFASRTFHVPASPHFDASLLAQPSPFISLGVVAVTLLTSVVLSTVIAGTIRFDAGLFCATVGMVALSIRSGRMGDLLRQFAPTASTPAVFVHLALELVALYAFVAVAWSLLWGLHTGGRLKADEFRDGIEDTDEPLPFKVAALVMQAGVMALGVLLLAATDDKSQTIAAVFISAFVGACCAYYMYPISPSPWLWVGPMLVGVAGYAIAYFVTPAADDAWRTGHLTHGLAPLARPIPLDYASAGPAGAILGYWMSRRWHRQRLAEIAAPEVPETSANPDATP
jgi:hypothetical protein